VSAQAKAFLFGLFASVAAAELGARALRLAPEEGFYGYPAGLLVPDDRLGFRYRPGFRGSFLGARYGTIPIEINARGFRGPDFAPEPAAGTLRVAGLGDSITFGAGVREGETYLRALEGRLRARGIRSEVLNFGVNHYDAAREALLLESDVLPTRPRLVLVGFCLNDGGAGEGVPSSPAPLAVRLLRTSAALRFGHRLVLGSSARYADSYQRLYLDRIEVDWKGGGEARVGEAIERMAQASRRASARLAVVAFPHRAQLARAGGSPFAIQDRLAQICGHLGLSFLDLRESFATRAANELFLPGDPWHPSRAGHALAAAALATFLERTGLLSPPPRSSP
jgi:lysophospholipase L1-like esterase